MTKSVFTDKYRYFLSALIRIRKEKSITQIQMAKALKKPQSFISKYESGERRLDVIETMDILSALNYPAEKFFQELTDC